MSKLNRVTTADPKVADPDLQTQLEDLLNQVWLCEREWTLDDRIALSLAVARRRG